MLQSLSNLSTDVSPRYISQLMIKYRDSKFNLVCIRCYRVARTSVLSLPVPPKNPIRTDKSTGSIKHSTDINLLFGTFPQLSSTGIQDSTFVATLCQSSIATPRIAAFSFVFGKKEASAEQSHIGTSHASFQPTRSMTPKQRLTQLF